jgi:hypothetical protein
VPLLSLQRTGAAPTATDFLDVSASATKYKIQEYRPQRGDASVDLFLVSPRNVRGPAYCLLPTGYRGGGGGGDGGGGGASARTGSWWFGNSYPRVEG